MCFHLYYLYFCILLCTCANVTCIKLLLTYLLKPTVHAVLSSVCATTVDNSVCMCIIWKTLYPYVLDARLGLRVCLEHAFTCVSTTNQAKRGSDVNNGGSDDDACTMHNDSIWNIQHSIQSRVPLRLTCSWRVTTYVDKPSAVGRPTRPTQPFILSGSINWVVSWHLVCVALVRWRHLVNAYEVTAGV